MGQDPTKYNMELHRRESEFDQLNFLHLIFKCFGVEKQRGGGGTAEQLDLLCLFNDPVLILRAESS